MKRLVDGRTKSSHDEDGQVQNHLQRQADGSDGLRGDTFAAAGEAEAIGRRCRHTDALGGETENLGNPLDHCRAMRADLRSLADDRHVDRRNNAAPRAYKIGRVA